MGLAGRRKCNQIRLLFLIFKTLSVMVACVCVLHAQDQQAGQPRHIERSSHTTALPPPPGADSLRSSSSLVRQQNLPGAAKVSPAPAQLSLTHALSRAISNKLATLLAQEQRRTAKGVTQEARSALLPNISASAYQASLTENLAALGFQPGTFPGITRAFIGPFNNFDARA